MKFRNTLLAFLVFAITLSSVSASAELLFGVHRSFEKIDPVSNLYSLDPETGVPTLIGPTSFGLCSGLDFNPLNGVLYAVCGDEILQDTVLITIDRNTGQGTLIGPLNLPEIFGFVTDISFRSDGVLFAYVESKPSDILGTINLNTGQFSTVGETSLFFTPGGLGFSLPDDLYFAGSPLPTGELYMLDQNDASPTFLTEFNFPGETRRVIESLDTNPEDGVLFMSYRAGPETTLLSVVDVDSGDVTIIGATGDLTIAAIAFLKQPVSNVPTMSQYGLVLSSVVLLLAALLVLRRRTFKSKA